MGFGGFTRTHSSFSWEPLTQLWDGQEHAFHSQLKNESGLNFDHVLAVKIGKSNITVNKTD